MCERTHIYAYVMGLLYIELAVKLIVQFASMLQCYILCLVLVIKLNET